MCHRLKFNFLSDSLQSFMLNTMNIQKMYIEYIQLSTVVLKIFLNDLSPFPKNLTGRFVLDLLKTDSDLLKTDSSNSRK